MPEPPRDDDEAVRAGIVALLPRLRRFAWSLTGSRDEGDDLVQAACLKALGALDQYRPGTRLDAWKFRILRTGWIDRARYRARRPATSDPETLEAISDAGVGARRAEARRAGLGFSSRRRRLRPHGSRARRGCARAAASS